MSAAERVGQLLGNDLAGRVIECFDFCHIQNRVAACVSVRWSTGRCSGGSSRQRLLGGAGAASGRGFHVRMDDFNDGMEETIAQNAAAAAAAMQGDPVATTCGA